VLKTANGPREEVFDQRPKGNAMPEQVLAVYENFLKPRGPAVDAGDLVLTAQHLCFIQLAAWEPNVNANPLLTAIAGTVGGFGAAAATTIGSVVRQKPEIVKLLASADKKRNTLWGMNLDERLHKTKSRWVIPIEEVGIEKTSDGVGVSVKTKGVGALSQSNLTHFELYPTKELDVGLLSILQAWNSRQIAVQAIEGYASKFAAPQLFLDELRAGNSPKTEWQESEMLGDSDYIARLESIFKEQAYRDQCIVLSTLRNASSGKLASLLQAELISSLREQLERAISKEVSIWLGRIFVPLSFALIIAAVVCFLSAKPGWADRTDGDSLATTGMFCLILLFFSALGALAWAVPYYRARTVRKRLQEQGVDSEESEAELRSTVEATTDAECSFSTEELRTAFSSDSSKAAFFRTLYSKPWKMQRLTFHRPQGVVEPDLRAMLAASAKAEGIRRQRAALRDFIVGLVAGGIVWFWYVSIPPHGYGSDAGPFLFVVVEAIFIVVCAIVTPVSLISSFFAFIATRRYSQAAHSLS
jgi:hypothetical protein